MRTFPILVLLPFLVFISCASQPEIVSRDDLKQYYDLFDVKGTFVLHDLKNRKLFVYNQEEANKPFTPASTFKILNSLIGLETGVVSDAAYTIPWDSVQRDIPNWNQDQSLASAFKYSAVWYYQEMARRIGEDQMASWVEKSGYGNADTSSGVDRFWLSGSLRITPIQQVVFLQRLYESELPFSKRSMDIVKETMVEERGEEYTLSSKTGWGNQDGEEIGWYVGYYQRGGNVYIFANLIHTPTAAGQSFLPARREIAYLVMQELGIMERKPSNGNAQ